MDSKVLTAASLLLAATPASAASVRMACPPGHGCDKPATRGATPAATAQAGIKHPPQPKTQSIRRRKPSWDDRDIKYQLKYHQLP